MLKFIAETFTISFFAAVVIYLPEIIVALAPFETAILVVSGCLTVAAVYVSWLVKW